MAEVDFGDSELFEQLDDSSVPVSTHIRFTEDEEVLEETDELKGKLMKYEETIRTLTEENQGLKRKLSVLTRPGGLIVDNAKIDGPLLQILFANNSISKQCRQEIEDCICSVIQKHQQHGKENNTSFNIIPQSSSFVMEDDHRDKTPCGVKTIKEAFSMVGSVLYFTSFCLDKLGQPLLNDNPQLTDGWEVPKYQQVFSQVIALDGQEVQIKEKRPKPCCFNCGSTDHQLRDCPMPKDMARINEKRKEFSHGSSQSNQRYHAEEVEERFAKYKPGIVSEELLAALGVDVNTLPPFIYRMRQLGYPPGWLKETEMENSGLTLYDGNVSSDGDPTKDNNGQKISYDVSKLVDFPGFNVQPPHSVKDEYRLYGSIPMQHNHLKQNYATYLSSFPTPGSICSKRRHESDSTPQQTKKRRSNPQSSDMDVDSEHDTPRRHRSSDSFQFQPPLPLGSPSFGSPPPLPQGTPPATPTPPPLPKGTPPPTPTNGSPALQGRTWGGAEDSGAGEEDGLTLEELEEQQRLIWAALENADTATNSDSETPAMGTPIPSSPSVSTPVHIDTETEMEEAGEETQRRAELSSRGQPDEDADGKKVVADKPSVVDTEEDSPQSPAPIKIQEDSPQSPAPMKNLEDSPQSPAPMKNLEDSPQSPAPMKNLEDSLLSPAPMKIQEDSPLSPTPVKIQEDSPLSPAPVKIQEDSPLSPAPMKNQEDSPLSPAPMKIQEDSPLSPTPMKIQEDSPLSPTPMKIQEDSPLSPAPMKIQEDSLLGPAPMKIQEDSSQSPAPMKIQEDSPQSPAPMKNQEDSPQSTAPMKMSEDSPQCPDPHQGAMETELSDSAGKVTGKVPHRSKFAEGIIPFEETPEFTEVAEATGTYLRIRDLLKSSPRNLAKNKK